MSIKSSICFSIQCFIIFLVFYRNTCEYRLLFMLLVIGAFYAYVYLYMPLFFPHTCVLFILYLYFLVVSMYQWKRVKFLQCVHIWPVKLILFLDVEHLFQVWYNHESLRLYHSFTTNDMSLLRSRVKARPSSNMSCMLGSLNVCV